MKIYHTPTKESYDDLMNYLEEKEYYWSFGKNPTEKDYWDDCESRTCVRLSDKTIRCSYLDYYKEEYPDIPIVEWKVRKKEKTMKTVEYNNVFPKEVYDVLSKYNNNGNQATFWKHWLDNVLPIEADDYLSNPINRRNVAITLATRDFECEKEPLGRILSDNLKFSRNLKNGGYLIDDQYVAGYKIKFTKEEFEEFKNSLVWEEIKDEE